MEGGWRAELRIEEMAGGWQMETALEVRCRYCGAMEERGAGSHRQRRAAIGRVVLRIIRMASDRRPAVVCEGRLIRGASDAGWPLRLLSGIGDRDQF